MGLIPVILYKIIFTLRIFYKGLREASLHSFVTTRLDCKNLNKDKLIVHNIFPYDNANGTLHNDGLIANH